MSGLDDKRYKAKLSLPPTPPLDQDRVLFFTDHCGNIITSVLLADTEIKVSESNTIDTGLGIAIGYCGREKVKLKDLGKVSEEDFQQIENNQQRESGSDIMSPAVIEDKSAKARGFKTAIEECPVTEERLPFIEKGWENGLRDPGTARANEAASVEAPNGTEKDNYAKRNQNLTVLQQHINFFDPDQDGIIYPLDTYNAMRRLAFSRFIALASTLIIHLNFSYPTLPPGQWIPDLKFRIYTERIHKDKHGSDSGTYDNEGRFIPQKFEEIFSKYAGGDKQGITKAEIWEYMKGQAVIMDPVGWFGALFEWFATWVLLWPEDGRMKKEDIRRIYDGSLFYEVAARNEKEKLQ
ncbi:hypothetical protein EYC84_006119 [Monilinia fructicola]|uniref:EF-hand domain-containing protein n=1 Tax=Monilinia fructicola TaxID=38448 RepID=A0A5M9K2D0_MONFR|nr:hypothetical protein EYC84_006119 [Monilinia fructicola]